MSQKLVLLPTPKKSLAQPDADANGNGNADVDVDAMYASPYHCLRSTLQLKAIEATVKLMKIPVAGKDSWQIGSVYIVEVGGSKYVKMGYTNSAGLDRAQEHINKCHLPISRMYITPGFRGAHRAEQILLKLTAEHNFRRYDCACRSESKSGRKSKFRKNGKPRCHEEWLQQSYEEAVATVLLVCDWMRYQMPYDPMETNNMSDQRPQGWKASLKPEWIDSLQQWQDTQYTKAPLGWQDFFWRHEQFWRGASVSQSPGRKGPTAALQSKQDAGDPPSNHMTRFVGNIPISNQEMYELIVQQKTTKIRENFLAGDTSVIRDTRTESISYHASHTVERTAVEEDLRDRYSESPCAAKDHIQRRIFNSEEDHSPLSSKPARKNRKPDIDIASLRDITNVSDDAFTNVFETKTIGLSGNIDVVCNYSEQDDEEERVSASGFGEASGDDDGNLSKNDRESTHVIESSEEIGSENAVESEEDIGFEDAVESIEDIIFDDIAESREDIGSEDTAESGGDNLESGKVTQTPRSVSPGPQGSNTQTSRRSKRLLAKHSPLPAGSSETSLKKSANRTRNPSTPNKQHQPNIPDQADPKGRSSTRVVTGELKMTSSKIAGIAKRFGPKKGRKGKVGPSIHSDTE